MIDTEGGEIQRMYSVTCAAPDCTRTKIVAALSKKEVAAILWEDDWSRYKRLGWTCADHEADRMKRLNRDRRLLQGVERITSGA